MICSRFKQKENPDAPRSLLSVADERPPRLSAALLISLSALEGERSEATVDGENANAASLFIKRLTRLAPHRGALNGPGGDTDVSRRRLLDTCTEARDSDPLSPPIDC